jgi:hypothetical protein
MNRGPAAFALGQPQGRTVSYRSLARSPRVLSPLSRTSGINLEARRSFGKDQGRAQPSPQDRENFALPAVTAAYVAT